MNRKLANKPERNLDRVVTLQNMRALRLKPHPFSEDGVVESSGRNPNLGNSTYRPPLAPDVADDWLSRIHVPITKY